MPLELGKINNQFLQLHLRYVEHTESPAIFHVWAALGCVSACMQRHLYLETGIGREYGNQYILLVGPPATKKSTAIRAASEVAVGCTDLKLAPDDTGGQRQGLITAMLETDELDEELDEAAMLDIHAIMQTQINLRGVDRHCLFACAPEFGSLMGQNNADLARFLIKTWDGDDYTYQLRETKAVIKDTLMTILGGTTPSDISLMLPKEAIGQGFMSRLILVYAAAREKRVPTSKMRFERELTSELQATYMKIANQMKGAMALTPAASRLLDLLEMTDVKINDTRFMFYTTRRQAHLRKLAIVLAASRCEMLVTEEDVRDANYILSVTEEKMPDALGEYGLSPVAIARQKMLEFIRYAGDPVPERLLWAVMHRDMRGVDFANSLSELINADKITLLEIQGTRHYLFKDEIVKTLQMLDDNELDVLLAESSEKIDKKRIN